MSRALREHRQLHKRDQVPVRPDSIAWGICHLIDDPVYMQSLGKAGRRKVMEKFRWAVITERMLSVYRKVLSDSP